MEEKMAKILIIGCGGVAEVFSEICIASRTLSKCEALKAKIEKEAAEKGFVVGAYSAAQIMPYITFRPASCSYDRVKICTFDFCIEHFLCDRSCKIYQNK